jgi:hypothetical protein
LQGRALLAHEIGHTTAPLPATLRLTERNLDYWLREAQASGGGAGLRGLSPQDEALLLDDWWYTFSQWRARGGKLPGE